MIKITVKLINEIIKMDDLTLADVSLLEKYIYKEIEKYKVIGKLGTRLFYRAMSKLNNFYDSREDIT